LKTTNTENHFHNQLELWPSEPQKADRRQLKQHPVRNQKEPSEMTNMELLTFILGAAHEPACARLSASYSSLRQLGDVHPADLRGHGLTTRAVERLGAVFETARRYGEEAFVSGQPFKGSYDIYAHFRERLAAETREHFVAVLLDNKHRKLRDVIIAVGSLTASVVHPRDVFRRVLLDAAAAVIFVHNHPSGDPTPGIGLSAGTVIAGS
jgi:DNA repair protein RadC